MAADEEEEARAHPRARAHIKVEYHFGGTTGVGHSHDISEGGIFLFCDRVARPGTRVYLRLHLPGSRAGDPLKIIGLVKRAVDPFRVGSDQGTPSGMGVEFEVAYARTREQLADFVETLLSAGQQDPPPAIQEIGGAYGARLGGSEALLDHAGVERAFSFAAADPKSGRLFQWVLLVVILALGLYVVIDLFGR